MSQLIAYCGLACSECPTFLASRADDDAARARTAAVYAEKFGFDLRPEEIDCDGCKSEGGTLMAYCGACAIRECCRSRASTTVRSVPMSRARDWPSSDAFSPGAKASFEALKEQAGGA